MARGLLYVSNSWKHENRLPFWISFSINSGFFQALSHNKKKLPIRKKIRIKIFIIAHTNSANLLIHSFQYYVDEIGNHVDYAAYSFVFRTKTVLSKNKLQESKIFGTLIYVDPEPNAFQLPDKWDLHICNHGVKHLLVKICVRRNCQILMRIIYA